jgi:hypothetical protein
MGFNFFPFKEDGHANKNLSYIHVIITPCNILKTTIIFTLAMHWTKMSSLNIAHMQFFLYGYSQQTTKHHVTRN